MTLKNLLGLSLDAVAGQGAHRQAHGRCRAQHCGREVAGLSTENRFDAAYKAIMQLAMVALDANGYRTMTSKPGHHQTAIQTLSTSVGLAPAKVILLDALRKQRNLSDYSGDLVPDAAAAECLTSASDLLAHVRAWLTANRPDLL
jgi:hypothetical protein